MNTGAQIIQWVRFGHRRFSPAPIAFAFGLFFLLSPFYSFAFVDGDARGATQMAAVISPEVETSQSWFERSWEYFHQSANYPPFASVAGLLDADEALYVLQPSADSLLVFRVMHGRTHLFVLRDLDAVMEKVHTVQSYCLTEPAKNDINLPDDYTRSAYQLYRDLLPGCELATRIHIVTGPSFSCLPFDALLTELASSTSYRADEVPFLVKDHPVVVHFSTDDMVTAMRMHKKRATHYFGFTSSARNNPDYGVATDKLGSHPSAKGSAGFGASLWGGKAFTGKNATLKNYVECANKTAILHIDLPVVNDQYGRFGFGFSGVKDDPEVLDAKTIRQTKLQAELVVLACSGGNETVNQPENYQYLQAFREAGAPSMAVSRWHASGPSGQLILRNFFSGLDLGETKDEALRESKLSYLNQAEGLGSHPYYWASFMMVGNPESMQLGKEHSTLSYWIGGGILVILVLIATTAKSRKLSLGGASAIL